MNDNEMKPKGHGVLLTSSCIGLTFASVACVVRLINIIIFLFFRGVTAFLSRLLVVLPESNRENVIDLGLLLVAFTLRLALLLNNIVVPYTPGAIDHDNDDRSRDRE